MNAVVLTVVRIPLTLQKSFGCNRLLRYDGINVKGVIQPNAESEQRDLSDDEFFVFQAVV